MFGYAKHLEQEIEYLRGQLAQKERRIDEMQQMLNSSVRYIQDRAKTELKRRIENSVDNTSTSRIPTAQPLGWDQVRATMRLQPKPKPEDKPEKEKADGVEK
jgi:L-lactate utilization protein LutC